MTWFCCLVFTLYGATGSFAICQNESVCVASQRNDTWCENNGFAEVMTKLSEFVKFSECKSVHIYLTSGTHTLSAKLIFNDSVEDTKIYGSPTGEPSIIQCINEAGIRFSWRKEGNRVLIKDVTFVRCASKYWDTKRNATLYFEYASYVLENVAINSSAGYGLCTYDCSEQVINNCSFHNNTGGHMLIWQNQDYCSLQFNIRINMTKFYGGNFITGEYSIVIASQCVVNSMTISIEQSKLVKNKRGGLHVLNGKSIQIKNCLISNNNGNGIFTDMGNYYSNYVQRNTTSNTTLASNTTIMIRNTTIEMNNGTGIIVYKRSFTPVTDYFMKTEIFNTTFANNYQALQLELSFYSGVNKTNSYQETRISGCTFEDHVIPYYTESAIIAINNNMGNFYIFSKSNRYSKSGKDGSKLIIERSSFRNNAGTLLDCSILYIKSMGDIMLDNVNIYDNNCTAITLSSSKLKILNSINIERNIGRNGGGLNLENGGFRKNSQIFFTRHSKVSIINNTAETYGGGILLQQTCAEISSECFFQLSGSLDPTSAVLVFSGNRAHQGGDIVFGGCLSNCTFNDTITLNKNDKSNPFWKLVNANDSSLTVHSC